MRKAEKVFLARLLSQQILDLGLPKPVVDYSVNLPGGVECAWQFGWPEYGLLVEIGYAPQFVGAIRNGVSALGWRIMIFSRDSIEKMEAVGLIRKFLELDSVSKVGDCQGSSQFVSGEFTDLDRIFGIKDVIRAGVGWNRIFSILKGIGTEYSLQDVLECGVGWLSVLTAFDKAGLVVNKREGVSGGLGWLHIFHNFEKSVPVSEAKS
jgi:hypothetical protein